MAKRGSHAIVCLPDAHFPKQDDAAVSIALAAIRKIKPRRVVVLGDWLEAEAFSRHPRNRIDAAAADFETELGLCNAALDEVQKHCRELVYIEGNHEARVEKHAANGDSAHRAAFEAVNPRIRLSRGRKRFTWVPYFGRGISHYEIAPDLWAIHGWSTAKSAAEKHAQAIGGRSVIYGHTHRMDVHISPAPDGRIQYAMSPGCLSTLQPDWTTSPTSWVHGFAVIYCRDDLTSWTPYPVIIRDGSCVLPSGEQVRG